MMILGGATLGGPRYIWWNFVSSRLERIEQAKEERAKGRFDTVPGYVEQSIPLPDTADKPRRATGGVFCP
ncbi:MAG: Pirin [uncultured Microvirga sp.]|uniref:Pirin n=1 Tax=uncultured Microvirga sp. TaxID=412392 RepID=A0A6J4LMN2_9HYPH|nr:MAG: Pirin [uncultured Microvirga sp.]